MITSLAQWRLSYMRAKPTSAAPPYSVGPITHTHSGHQMLVSAVTADAAANPATAWPDGNDRYRVSDRKPRNNCQLFGFGTLTVYGRARPNVYFMAVATPSPMNSASVPCNPSCARRRFPLNRPVAYIVVPMMTAPGTAIVLSPSAAFCRYHLLCGAGD